MSRVAIFIDGAYLDYIQKEEFGGIHLDMEKLANELASGKEMLRTYYYHCEPYQSNPPTKDEAERFGRTQKFFNRLNRLNRFEVRLGKLAYRGIDEEGKHIFEQKRVDILLGVDLAVLSSKGQIGEAVLLAGDSDFLPAIQAAKDQGVLIRLYHGKNVHRELWQMADDRVEMDINFAKKLEFKNKKK